MTQGDLFDDHQQQPEVKPTAAIFTFPLARCAGRARETAVAISLKKSPGAMQTEFERRCRDLGKRLRAAGIDADEVERQIVGFTQAVNDQLGRMHDGGRRSPGGAA